MAFVCTGENKNYKKRVVLPPIKGANRGSMASSVTLSLVTSGSTSSEVDSDVEEIATSPAGEGKEACIDDETGAYDGETKDATLSLQAEKEIRQRAKEGLKNELIKIQHQARTKQAETRKQFKEIINNARSELIHARIEAEKISINKLEERAERQQAKIMKERTQRKKEVKTRDGESQNSKAHLEELASLRKIQADLDRARARRKHSLAAVLTTVNGKSKVSNLLQREVKQLERAEEIQQFIVELHSLGLTHSANKLTHALGGKEASERRLRAQLQEDQLKARNRAVNLMEDEIERARKEHLSEMERSEQERLKKEKLLKERREKKRREREMAQLKELAKNKAKNRMYNESFFNTRVSRQFSFSYFPFLKK